MYHPWNAPQTPSNAKQCLIPYAQLLGNLPEQNVCACLHHFCDTNTAQNVCKSGPFSIKPMLDSRTHPCTMAHRCVFSTLKQNSVPELGRGEESAISL